jgi:MFS family permease
VLLGGVLTQAFGWPAIFYINVPVGIVAAAGTPRLIPALRPAEGTHARIDVPGAVLVTAGLAAVAYGLLQGSEAGWTAARTLVSLSVGAVLLALFVVVEHRSKNPLVPLRIFSLRSVSSANTVMLLTGAAIVSLFFFLSLYMRQVLGYTPLKAGLTQLPLAVVLIDAAGAAPALIAAIGRKVTLAAGLAVLAGGLAWSTQVPVAGTYTGSILGPSLATAQITHLLPQTATATDRLAALTSGYQMGFLASAAFAAAAALVTLIAVPGGKDGQRA